MGRKRKGTNEPTGGKTGRPTKQSKRDKTEVARQVRALDALKAEVAERQEEIGVAETVLMEMKASFEATKEALHAQQCARETTLVDAEVVAKRASDARQDTLDRREREAVNRAAQAAGREGWEDHLGLHRRLCGRAAA